MLLRNSDSQVEVRTSEQQITDTPHQEDDHIERIITIQRNSKKQHFLLQKSNWLSVRFAQKILKTAKKKS
jgi:hypothetical protein